MNSRRSTLLACLSGVLLFVARLAHADPFAYVVGLDTISVIDTATNTIVATVPVSDGTGVAITPDGRHAYVVTGTGDIVVIDTATHTVTDTVTALRGNILAEIAITPDGAFAYVASRFGLMFVIATATNTILTHIGINDDTSSIAISPDGHLIYVVARLNSTIQVISTATNTLLPGILPPLFSDFLATGLAVPPDGDHFYVTNQATDSVWVYFNPVGSFPTLITTVDVGNDPEQIAFAPDGTKMFVTNSAGGSVSVIDSISNSVVATVPVGLFPQSIAVTPNGSRAYVANLLGDTISVIDTINSAVIATVETGVLPRAIAVTLTDEARELFVILTAQLPDNQLGTSLSDKVTLAQSYYEAGDMLATCAVLSDFLRQVRAQSGKKKLPTAIGDKLIADATAIMTAINCGA